MNYGVNLPAAGECGDPRTLAEFAWLAEETGWDGIFLEDYLVYHNDTYRSVRHPGVPTFDPWVALAAMSVATSRVRLGTLVTGLPRRRPQKLAREALSVQELSEGRLVLGLGSGDVLDHGFVAFSEEREAKRRACMLDEGLYILRGLWSGEQFSYPGEHYTVEEVTFAPQPSSRIPIWIGGSTKTPAVLRRAASQDGISPYKLPDTSQWEDFTAEEVRGLRDKIARRRENVDAFDVVIGGRERARDWDAERELISSLQQAGATWWMEWVPAGGYEQMRRAIERGPLDN